MDLSKLKGNSTTHSELGFTLVEVLIASAIVMASIGVLLQLFVSGLDRMHRSGVLALQTISDSQILYEINMTNPATQRSGESVVEGQPYKWRSEPVTNFTPVVAIEGSSGKEAALFKVRVTVNLENGSERSFEFLQLGWKKVL